MHDIDALLNDGTVVDDDGAGAPGAALRRVSHLAQLAAVVRAWPGGDR